MKFIFWGFWFRYCILTLFCLGGGDKGGSREHAAVSNSRTQETHVSLTLRSSGIVTVPIFKTYLVNLQPRVKVSGCLVTSLLAKPQGQLASTSHVSFICAMSPNVFITSCFTSNAYLKETHILQIKEPTHLKFGIKQLRQRAASCRFFRPRLSCLRSLGWK